MKKSEVIAIILCGGVGSRFKNNIPKQLIKIEEKPIFEYTIDKFNRNINVDKIILVINEKYQNQFRPKDLYKTYFKIGDIVVGGKTRRESVLKGLEVISNEKSKILIHDGVRPFVSEDTINRCIEALDEHDAIYPAVNSADTLIEVNEKLFISNIPNRKYMRRGQTPQGFKFSIIKKAHQLALNDVNVDEEITNDCGLIKRYNLCEIKVVEGNRENFKITYPGDLELFNQVIKGDKNE
ncbi:MAG: 2-C-methyl-D-erythritol 4-phosphate cytidylyltransferase [Bacilli bacterium]|jgi:2-C-methyl-D-erythritol 4-phosphate cytidylyltransferase